MFSNLVEICVYTVLLGTEFSGCYLFVEMA